MERTRLRPFEARLHNNKRCRRTYDPERSAVSQTAGYVADWKRDSRGQRPCSPLPFGARLHEARPTYDGGDHRERVGDNLLVNGDGSLFLPCITRGGRRGGSGENGGRCSAGGGGRPFAVL